MAIETTEYSIADENANKVTDGAILDLEVRVMRKVLFERGTPDYTYFAAHFRRDGADEPFRWDSTTDEAGMGAMGDSHVVATYEAADHIEEHYRVGVDLGLLSQ
jgi:hypothetical protein